MTESDTPTLPDKIVQEHCPTCDGERQCLQIGHVYVPWHWKDDREGFSMSGGVDHSMLQCRGCETVFYLHDSWNDEEVEFWRDLTGEEHGEMVRTKVTYPKPVGQRPKWLELLGKRDPDLKNILQLVYTAVDTDCLILAAIGVRTAIDHATEVLGIDPAKTFAKKLDELKSGGWIGSTERDVLGVLTDAGSAAAHRGWQPDEDELRPLLTALEAFIHCAVLTGKEALKVKNSIPPKPKRSGKPAT